MLYFRDHVSIIPTIKSYGQYGLVSGLLSAIDLPAGTYYTEAMEVGTYVELLAFLNVTQAGSTLDVRFQVSPDKLKWVDVADAMTQVTTSTGVTFKRLTANFGQYVRAVIIVTGGDYIFTLTLHAKG